MLLFWQTKKEKKFINPNSIDTTATASKFWTLSGIKTIVYKDEEVISLNIDI